MGEEYGPTMEELLMTEDEATIYAAELERQREFKKIALYSLVGLVLWKVLG